jgi:ribosomal protein S18 acetylase RimI-like enzyme
VATLIEVDSASGRVEDLRNLVYEYSASWSGELRRLLLSEKMELDSIIEKSLGTSGDSFIALEDGSPVGCVLVIPNERIGDEYLEVSKLYVRPLNRRAGIGGQLMRRAISAIALKGRIPYLYVEESRVAAINLYRSEGFRLLETQSIPGYLEMTLNALR